METVSAIEDVQAFETRGGNTRYVARDVGGAEYTTFRETIAARAKDLLGKRVRIVYHEARRGQYTNIYLDDVELVEDSGSVRADTDDQEAAWRTAVEAAPWLIGTPREHVPPDELYEKLKPFEARIAADITGSGEPPDSEDE